MFDAALADLLPVYIQDAGLVELHSPVHSNVERKLLLHGSTSDLLLHGNIEDPKKGRPSLRSSVATG